jgi:amino acid transporter
MEAATLDRPDGPEELGDGSPTLKQNAISALSSMVIGTASTAPGFAIAVTLGFVVAISRMGTHAPAVMLVGFVPMFCIAMAYKGMNRADPDCGTSFSWITRAFGPTTGWVGGWAILMAEIVVNANQAQFAAIYGFQLFGWTAAANSLLAQTALGVVFIVVLTWICYIGIQLSARTQRILLGMELFTLLLFSIVALVKVYTEHVAHSMQVSLSWFDPFTLGFTPLLLGVLLAVFLYWGWDAGVSVNEETKHAGSAPGRAAVGSTILLVGIVVLVTVAAQAFAGTGFLANPANSSDVFGGSLGHAVLGPGLDKLLIIALLSSSTAATQTTILPAARSALSMARRGAIPKQFGEIHPVHRTPAFATLVVGALSIVWFVFILQVSTNVLSDCITGLGFLICFYYGFTGFACTWFYRRELFKSLGSFLSLGLLPTVGGLALMGVFVKSFLVYENPANDVSKPLLGLGVPVWIGVGLLVLGFILAIALRIPYPQFFKERLMVAGDELMTDASDESLYAEMARA